MCKSKPMHQWYSLNKNNICQCFSTFFGPQKSSRFPLCIYTCNIYHYHGALLVHYFETSPKKGHGTVHCRHVLTFGGFKIFGSNFTLAGEINEQCLEITKTCPNMDGFMLSFLNPCFFIPIHSTIQWY